MNRLACSSQALLAGAVLGCGSGVVATSEVSSQQVSSIEGGLVGVGELWDFYLQDVCYTDPTADPYNCQGASRNIYLDEPVQYVMSDGYGSQATVSVPIRLGSGNPGDPIGVLHIFDYDRGEHPGSSFLEFNTAWGAMSAINPNGGWPNDGWDVMEANGGFASYIGTADGGSRVLNWVHATGPGTCVFDDAWLLWDQNNVYRNAPQWTTAYLVSGGDTNGAGFCQSGATNNTAGTTWDVRWVCYDSGKCLESLVTWHGWGYEGAREVDYYTKPYGRTRWEAWSCPDRQNCSLADHRDWSFYRGGLDAGGWLPAFQWPTYYPQAKGNWLAGGDFGMAGMCWDCGGYYTWNRWNDSNWAYIQEWPGGLRNGNHYLAVSNPPGSGWRSVYQDVPASGAGPGWWFAFGVRALASNVGDYGYVILRVWELGTPYYHDIAFTPNTWDRALHWSYFDTQGYPYAYRLEFYIPPNFNGWFDDAFLAQT